MKPKLACSEVMTVITWSDRQQSKLGSNLERRKGTKEWSGVKVLVTHPCVQSAQEVGDRMQVGECRSKGDDPGESKAGNLHQVQVLSL